jgi:hypothetical protein
MSSATNAAAQSPALAVAHSHDLIRVHGAREKNLKDIHVELPKRDLGPGAGHEGGRIVFQGTPADLVATRGTLTAEHLAASLWACPTVSGYLQTGVSDCRWGWRTWWRLG